MQVAVNITRLKCDLAKKRKLPDIPKLTDIIAAVPEDYRDKLVPYLKSKPVRTASGEERKDNIVLGDGMVSSTCGVVPLPSFGPGIAVVAVMSKPHRCPHIAMTGNVCVYCPGGPDSDFEYSTQVGRWVLTN